MSINRISTLADFLNVSTAEIQPETYRENLFTTPDGEYLVLTDLEARHAAEEYISNSLWAFRANFILETCNLTFSDGVVKSLEAMQCKCCDKWNAI